jgi:hypothetical protein
VDVGATCRKNEVPGPPDNAQIRDETSGFERK